MLNIKNSENTDTKQESMMVYLIFSLLQNTFEMSAVNCYCRRQENEGPLCRRFMEMLDCHDA